MDQTVLRKSNGLESFYSRSTVDSLHLHGEGAEEDRTHLDSTRLPESLDAAHYTHDIVPEEER